MSFVMNRQSPCQAQGAKNAEVLQRPFDTFSEAETMVDDTESFEEGANISEVVRRHEVVRPPLTGTTGVQTVRVPVRIDPAALPTGWRIPTSAGGQCPGRDRGLRSADPSTVLSAVRRWRFAPSARGPETAKHNDPLASPASPTLPNPVGRIDVG